MTASLRPHLRALIPGLVPVALMLVWAVHNGGYDADTWYWGALLLLGLLAAVLIGGGLAGVRLSRRSWGALVALGLYVIWSYLSISWAESPGDALQGSNRALLYLTLFALLLSLPWTTESALVALLVLVIGLGIVALVLLLRLATGDQVQRLVVEGRLAAPIGYVNGTAALFTFEALTAIVLAARRQLPVALRAGLLAAAAGSLQLALIVQSRGWLFTLPLIALACIAIVADRLRVVVAGGICAAAVVVPVHALLNVYRSGSGTGLPTAAQHAGRQALLSCGVVLLLGLALASLERRRALPRLARRTRLVIGSAITAAVAVVAVAGAFAATSGHPLKVISKQWRGFSHPLTQYSSGSHFVDAGSGRYDYWRVSILALRAHPIGGLGQDNFTDYYLPRRRTTIEPSWTHSLEMRLLAHTGIVGFVLFVAFLACALAEAIRARRVADVPGRALAGAALIPLVDWLIHGSLDWFWEIPALAGPALGFLAVAMALGRRSATAPTAAPAPRALPRAMLIALGSVALLAATAALALPYLAVRETSIASDIGLSNPRRALADLARAADLNPLSATPDQLAGTVALRSGDPVDAERRFRLAIARERGSWYAWWGDGLAASSLGEVSRAKRDFTIAHSINSTQRGVRYALQRVSTSHPLQPAEAFKLLTIIG